MLLRKEHELVELLIEYDRSIIVEGILSWEEKDFTKSVWDS